MPLKVQNPAKKPVKIPGPEIGYVDLLNQETEATIAKERDSGKRWFPLRPSNLGKCTRELAYELFEYLGYATYEKKLENPDSHRLLKLGKYVENHLIREFESHGLPFSTKYKQQVVELFSLVASSKPELSCTIEGSLDTVFWSEEHKALIDFKSKKDKFSAYYSTNWQETSEKLSQMESVVQISQNAYYITDLGSFLDEIRDPFFEANFLQLNGYACTQFAKSRGIDHAAIIQLNKNDSRLREIRFTPCENVFEIGKEKFQNVLRAAEEKDLNYASRDYALGSIKCAFCPFSKHCWEGDDTLKAFFGTFPRKEWPTDVPRDLQQKFASYEAEAESTDRAQKLEDDILLNLVDKKITKVKLKNGNVYEVKHLKSPKPHFELRRSKI